ncbi:MAG: RNA-directed DNA polymerase [bacterium]
MVKGIPKAKIAEWLLEEGYYPEQYVLPPCFRVCQFNLNKVPFFKAKKKRSGNCEFKPSTSDLITVSFPKSQLTDRTFGIIEPQIYHDLVWYIQDEWDSIIKHLFHKDIHIYSYSFPIPVDKQSHGKLGKLRAGRMIYEWIEMAENDLVAEAYRFRYMLTTDIKNFYPSIYPHSIAWALHGKTNARSDHFRFALLGTKLDKLCQNANDGCTNGLPIGSAITDLISEILLAAIDHETSKSLISQQIDFLAVRFKDDYRFLCSSRTDAEKIIKTLQSKMRYYNLTLNESKSEIRGLPEGLFRTWTSKYQKHSLRYKRRISYKTFETSLLAALQIDKEFPDTGVIDKFLSELVSKKHNLKLRLTGKNIFKAFSLLMLLKERRSKAFPQILAIIELIIMNNKKDKSIVDALSDSLESLLTKAFSNSEDNQYDLLWLTYLIKSNRLKKIKWPKFKSQELLASIKSNKQRFYSTVPNIQLFDKIKFSKKSNMIKHLAPFQRP